jgi:large subunit ribosomal protein L21
MRRAEKYMYAVFQSGGKQHRVAEGQTVRLEKIEVAPGESVDFDDILMVSNGDDIKIGTPYVAGGKVTAEVVTHGRGEKINIVKFRRRKHSRKQMGHRQWFTEVKITAINA